MHIISIFLFLVMFMRANSIKPYNDDSAKYSEPLKSYLPGCSAELVVKYNLENVGKHIGPFGDKADGIYVWSMNNNGVLDCGAIQKKPDGCHMVEGSDPTVEFLKYHKDYNKLCNGKVRYPNGSIHKIKWEARKKAKKHDHISPSDAYIVKAFKTGCTTTTVTVFDLKTNGHYMGPFGDSDDGIFTWAFNNKGILDCGAIQKNEFNECVLIEGSDPTVEFLKYQKEYNQLCDGKIKFPDGKVHKVKLEEKGNGILSFLNPQKYLHSLFGKN